MLNLKPFLVSAVGCLADFMTTVMGLGRGYVETHAAYTPVNALAVFTAANLALAVSLPDRGAFKAAKYAVSGFSFLGAVNNLLVLSGLYGGLVI